MCLAINPNINRYCNAFGNIKGNHILLQIKLSKPFEFLMCVGRNSTTDIGTRTDCGRASKIHIIISLATVSINSNTHTSKTRAIATDKNAIVRPAFCQSLGSRSPEATPYHLCSIRSNFERVRYTLRSRYFFGIFRSESRDCHSHTKGQCDEQRKELLYVFQSV